MKVGAIAGRMLKAARRCRALYPIRYWDDAKQVTVHIGTMGELKAVCASALTQRPSRKRTQGKR